MKTTILATLVSMGMLMGTTVFADDLKKAEIEKPTNLSAQVIDNSKDATTKSEPKKDDTAVRPFHFIGHSE